MHKCISQCTNIFLSAQIYFSVHKSISQCTNLFLSARQISVHKSCLNEKCNLSVCMQSFLSEFLQVSYFLVSLFSSVGGHICSSWAIQDSFLLLRRKRDSKVSRLSLALGDIFHQSNVDGCFLYGHRRWMLGRLWFKMASPFIGFLGGKLLVCWQLGPK